VISGVAEQHDELEHFLNDLEAQKEVHFGTHRSKESIMSCYVRDRKDQHIHFVDGGDGGYTKAARVLKTKFSSD
jgi:precorrin-6B methylase 1